MLKIDKDTAAAPRMRALKSRRPAAEAPTAKRPYFTFPIVGGKGKGSPRRPDRALRGLRFSADSNSVVVKRFVIELDRAVLTAKVAGTGQRITLLRLGAPDGVKIGDGRIVLKGVNVRLTNQAAEALNEALDTDLFAGWSPHRRGHSHRQARTTTKVRTGTTTKG